MTQLFCGQNRWRVLGGAALALAVGAVAAIGCGGATGGLPSGVSGALNNVRLTTTVISLSTSATSSNEVRVGTIGAIGTRYLKVTLKGAGYDGDDISYFYNTSSSLAAENGVSGFGSKELIYEPKDDATDKLARELGLRPVTKKGTGADTKLYETASYTFKTKGSPAKEIKVKVGDVRRKLTAEGDFTSEPATEAEYEAIIGGVHLSSIAESILNKEEFDVVFDFMDYDGDGLADAGIQNAIARLSGDEIPNTSQTEKLPNNKLAFKIYRVILPGTGKAEEGVLSLTGNYNTENVGDPTLGYSALMEVSLKVSGIPLGAKKIVVTAVEENIRSGGVSSDDQRTTYEFTKRVKANGGTLLAFVAPDVPGGNTYSQDLRFFVVNRLRPLRFEVRAFSHNPTSTLVDLEGGSAADVTKLNSEAVASPALTFIPIATNVTVGDPLEASRPSAGQGLLNAKATTLSSVLKSVKLDMRGTLTYRPVAPFDGETIDARSQAEVNTFVLHSDKNKAAQNIYEAGVSVTIDLPKRIAPVRFFRAKTNAAPPVPPTAYVTPREITPDEVTGFLSDVSNGTDVFSRLQQTGLGSPSVALLGSGASAVAVVFVKPDLAPSFAGSTSIVESKAVELKPFGAGQDLKARADLKGVPGNTQSATLTIEECSEAPGSPTCTETGILFTQAIDTKDVSGFSKTGYNTVEFGKIKEIPFVSRGLGYQLTFRIWSEKEGRGVILAERIVGRNDKLKKVKGVPSPEFQTLAESELARTASIFSSELLGGDSNVKSFALVPAGTQTSRGAQMQFTPQVELKSPNVVVSVNPAVVAFDPIGPGEPAIEPVSGKPGLYQIENQGTGQRIFNVSASLLLTKSPSDPVPDPQNPLKATSVNVTIVEVGQGDVTVTASGFHSDFLGDAWLTGPQQFVLKERNPSDGSERLNSTGPVYGFNAGSRSQKGVFRITPLTTLRYSGKYVRLASGVNANGVVLAESPFSNEQVGAGGINLAVGSGVFKVNSNVTQVGILTTAVEPGEAVNSANIKTNITAKDGQVITLIPAVRVGATWYALDPSMVSFSNPFPVGSPHQKAGNTFIISTDARLANETVTVTMTYYEVNDPAIPVNFTISIPANRRNVGVIVK